MLFEHEASSEKAEYGINWGNLELDNIRTKKTTNFLPVVRVLRVESGTNLSPVR